MKYCASPNPIFPSIKYYARPNYTILVKDEPPFVGRYTLVVDQWHKDTDIPLASRLIDDAGTTQ